MLHAGCAGSAGCALCAAAEAAGVFAGRVHAARCGCAARARRLFSRFHAFPALSHSCGAEPASARGREYEKTPYDAHTEFFYFYIVCLAFPTKNRGFISAHGSLRKCATRAGRPRRHAGRVRKAAPVGTICRSGSSEAGKLAEVSHSEEGRAKAAPAAEPLSAAAFMQTARIHGRDVYDASGGITGRAPGAGCPAPRRSPRAHI